MRNKNSALLRRILYPATGLLAGLTVAVAQCPAHAEPIRPADAVGGRAPPPAPQGARRGTGVGKPAPRGE